VQNECRERRQRLYTEAHASRGRSGVPGLVGCREWRVGSQASGVKDDREWMGMGLRAYRQNERVHVCIVEAAWAASLSAVAGESTMCPSSVEDGLPRRNRPKRARHTAGMWNATRDARRSTQDPGERSGWAVGQGRHGVR
jgi:hypothetical protein